MQDNETDLVFRLRERARIRRQIPGRKSVEEGTPDRIANILEEAANRIEQLEEKLHDAKMRSMFTKEELELAANFNIQEAIQKARLIRRLAGLDD